MAAVRYERVFELVVRRVLARSIAAGGLTLLAPGCGCPPEQYEVRLVTVSPAEADALRELDASIEGIPLATCALHCAPSVTVDDVSVPFVACQMAHAEPLMICEYQYVCEGAGRRPAGLLTSGAVAAADPVAAWLAEAAHLEAAAVVAFEQLTAELEVHRAPARLVAAARRGRRDEVAHAQAFDRLARARGVTPTAAAAAPVGPRTLEALALDNATEGCVGETYGALALGWMARTAPSAELRALARRVARDEGRHAAFSWRLDAWLRARLGPAASHRLDEARDQRRSALAAALARTTPPELVRALGLPTSSEALALLDALLPAA